MYRKRAIIAALVLSICVPSLAFARSLDSTIVNTSIVVLQPGDNAPVNAKAVNTLNIDEHTGNRSYYELIQNLKLEAAKEDANIIKINNLHEIEQQHICDHLNVTLYKIPDNRIYEKEINWNGLRKLTWDDFKGQAPADAADNTAAVTYCGIGFETNNATEYDKPKVYVYNIFYANQSWVRADEKNTDVLAHEQGHFDICELYTRRLREKVQSVTITPDNMKVMLTRIYNEVNNAYEACQQRYEAETEHGLNTPQQQKWQSIIAQELNKTTQYALAD